MAFEIERLQPVGPGHYRYVSSDSAATVITANYFAEAAGPLQVGDLIDCLQVTWADDAHVRIATVVALYRVLVTQITTRGSGGTATSVLVSQQGIVTGVAIEFFGGAGDWDGSSGTDNTEAIEAAVASGFPIKFRSGATYYHTPLDLEGVNIDWSSDGEAPATLYCDTLPDSYQAQFKGAEVGTTTVAAAAYPMENVLTLADASDIEAGDLLVIQNDTLWQAEDRGTAFEGQVAKVIAIDGDDVQLDAVLTCGMPIGADVTIYRPIQLRLRNIQFERLRFNGSGRGTLMLAADHLQITGGGALNASRYGLHLHRCYRGEVSGGRYEGANYAIAGSLGYGILVESCWNTVIQNVVTRECRRGIDISGYTGVPSWYCIVRGCRFEGGGFAEDGSDFWPLGVGSAGCGSHGPASGTVYENNIAVDCYTGFTVRGRDETFRNNTIVGACVNPFLLSEGGGTIIEGNRYTDSFEEGLATPGTTTAAVSYERRPDSLVHINPDAWDQDKHLTVRFNTARNVKSALITVEGSGNAYNWLVHDNTVVVDDDSVPAGTIGIISGTNTPDAYNFRGWNNNIYAPTTFSIRKYQIDLVAGNVLQLGPYTYRVALTDDTAARIRVGVSGTNSRIGVRIYQDTASSTPRFNGVVRYQNATSIDWGGSSGTTVAATALAGTTGTDGNTTIAYADDSLYIENRSGATLTMIVIIEGAH